MKPVAPPDEPQTLQEWLWRIKRYEDGVYVRHQGIDGKWDSVALSELPAKQWAENVARWLEEGVVPVRVKEPWEMETT